MRQDSQLCLKDVSVILHAFAFGLLHFGCWKCSELQSRDYTARPVTTHTGAFSVLTPLGTGFGDTARDCQTNRGVLHYGEPLEAAKQLFVPCPART